MQLAVVVHLCVVPGQEDINLSCKLDREQAI
jgi:hypothetical protein